ncbi:MAG TPA: TonB-dependent receptor plug domain-containing protein, partial [Niabella sp.]|nr:TonB-dependent receptor plug domain-containing protein [Niabella sp.]
MSLKTYCCILLLLLGIFSFYTSLAQENLQVSGVVVNSQGTPVEGASIGVVENSLLGTISGADGKFMISVPGNATLTISSIGYVTRNIAVNNQRKITITLEATVSGMDEVVVIGYGTVKKVNLTGAVSSVSGEDLAKRQVGQTSMALQGVAPGVTVTQSTGQPGYDGGSIRIRGIGTLNNSDPLVLVDGIVMSMNNVDPSSIESISVLKDAASSAIYGSRAANGVILITTKRGKSGKFSVVYDAYVGKQDVTRSAKKVNGLDHI